LSNDTNINIDLSEFIDLTNQVQSYLQTMDQNVARVLVASGHLIKNCADKNIRAHLSSGNVYQRGGVEHTASEEGNYPNSDLGFLANSLRVVQSHETVFVGALENVAPYAEYLEDEDILNRPFLKPSYETIEPRMFKLVEKAIKGAK
jgi:hypothetical protein